MSHAQAACGLAKTITFAALLNVILFAEATQVQPEMAQVSLVSSP
jgi:hypothetical protein